MYKTVTHFICVKNHIAITFYCGLAAVSDGDPGALWERVSVRAAAPCWRMLTICGCMLVRVCSVKVDVKKLNANSILQLKNVCPKNALIVTKQC